MKLILHPLTERRETDMLKRSLLLTLFALAFVLLAPPASAQTPPVCTGAPILTGTIGSQSSSSPSAELINSIQKHVTQSYSWTVSSNFGSATISFGAASGVQILTGSACFTAYGQASPGTGDCVGTGWTGAPVTKVFLAQTTDAAGIPITRVMLNNVKAFELYGLGVSGSISATAQTFSEGIARIRQDTGSNSRLYFEGWHLVNGVYTWKSVPARFFTDCGYVT